MSFFHIRNAISWWWCTIVLARKNFITPCVRFDIEAFISDGTISLVLLGVVENKTDNKGEETSTYYLDEVYVLHPKNVKFFIS